MTQSGEVLAKISKLLRFHRTSRPSKEETVILGERAFLHPGSRIFNARTVLKHGARVNGPLTVHGRGALYIGAYAAVGSELLAITSNHTMKLVNLQVNLQRQIGGRDNQGSPDDVVIGPTAWVGDRVTLLPGSHIGVGCIVGACSIVTKPCPDFSVVAGNPVRVIRFRFHEDVRQGLLGIRWWMWSQAKMKRNVVFFDAAVDEESTWSDLEALIVP